MPIGSFALVGYIANEMVHSQPKRILDAGIGMGFYGAVVRQWLDSGFKFQKELIGIEGFNQYRNPAWDLYDHVYEDDIRNVLTQFDATNEKFDFIVFSDVLEHFAKHEGKNILSRLVGLLNPQGVIMIGTPAVFDQQGAVHGNEFERHESLWVPSEFFPIAYDLNCDITIYKNGEPDEFQHCMLLVKFKKI